MGARGTRWSWLLALAAAAALAGCGGAERRGIAEGERFPVLALTGLDGSAASTQNYAGRTLVVNFWATWCPPCRREMPSLERLARRLDPKRYAVIGITVDRDLNLAREFLLQHGVSFANFADPELAIANGVVGVVGFPETFIVAPDGRLAKRIAGEREWDSAEMLALLEATR